MMKMMLGLWVVEEDVDFRCSRPQSARTQGSDAVTLMRLRFGPCWG
jgi:hypothetical protein